MSNAVLITREPVINKQYKITANRVIVHASSVGQAVETLSNLADVWPGTHPVFVSLYRLVPTPDLLAWRAPPNAMVEIPTQAIAHLEAALKTIPLIGQAAAIGDNRKFCSAILVLDPEAAGVWAQAHGREGVPLAELATDPKVVAEVQAGVDEVNQQFAQVEQIKKFVLIGEEWLPDSDLLTPTSKLKRHRVNARYASEIDEMYAGLD